jgi:pimeloyl-ACP methyl ester carboxylesterase
MRRRPRVATGIIGVTALRLLWLSRSVCCSQGGPVVGGALGTGQVIEVASSDGTVVGVECLGSGPALLAVHGGTADRSRWAPVREALAELFTLHLLDRRGRGASTREAAGPYALEREVEDVTAVIEMIDAPTLYLGHSYGAIVGMEALARTGRIEKALLYEPPFDAGGYEVVPASFRGRFSALLRRGRREDALELFYSDVVGIDPAPMRPLPVWQARLAAVHTLEREGEAAASYVPDVARLAAIRTPVRVLLGCESPPAFKAAAAATADAIPGAELVEVAGQGHGMIDADPDRFVSLVAEFFAPTDSATTNASAASL